MVVSQPNRRLAWLKVTVCLGLPWLWQNHNVAPGNRMSCWPCAKPRICARATSNQEFKNWCVSSPLSLYNACSLIFMLFYLSFLFNPSNTLRMGLQSSRCAALCCLYPFAFDHSSRSASSFRNILFEISFKVTLYF